MLKGETLIELKDVHTGKIERYKDTNMFTDALFTALTSVRNGFHHYNDIYHQFLGGIVCFDKQLEEVSTNCFPPGDATVTASGSRSRSSTGSHPKIGNFNAAESVVDLQSRFFKQVYDFGTSQGNGLIRSVCLTDNLGGLLNYSNFYTSQWSTSIYKCSLQLCAAWLNGKPSTFTDVPSGNNGGYYSFVRGSDYYMQPCQYSMYGAYTSTINKFFPIALDLNNDISYWIKFENTTSIRLRKIKTKYQHASILEAPTLSSNAFRYTDSYIYLSDMNLPSNFYSNPIAYNVDRANNTLYIVFLDAGAIKICCVNIETDEVSYYSLANNTGKTLTLGYTNNSTYCNGKHAIVNDGYLYIAATDNSLYKIALDNPTNVALIENTLGFGVDWRYIQFWLGVNGRIYGCSAITNGFPRLYVVNGVVNTLELSMIPPYNSNTSNYYWLAFGLPIINCGTLPLVYFTGEGNSQYEYNYSDNFNSRSVNVSLLSGALMTINNLGTPITKTADKTMKVTYTVYESDSQPPESSDPEPSE